MFYKDLSKYTYTYTNKNDNHLNIGWLDDKHDFPKGDFPEKKDLLFKLKKLKTYKHTKGSHTCQICGKRLGNSEFIIKYNNIYYHAPNSLSHYIIKHDYKPPQIFIDAVLNKDQIKKKNESKYIYLFENFIKNKLN